MFADNIRLQMIDGPVQHSFAKIVPNHFQHRQSNDLLPEYQTSNSASS